MKRISVLLAIAGLSGCAVIDPNYYQTVTTAEICHGLLTLPPMNVNHGARLRELTRRGENCGSPVDVARSQQRAGQQLGEAIKALTPPPPPPQVNCTTQYVGMTAYTTCR